MSLLLYLIYDYLDMANNLMFYIQYERFLLNIIEIKVMNFN